MDVKDILILDPFNDVTGDFKIDDSNIQNQLALLYNSPGQFYQWPTLGVDARDSINSPVELQLLRARVITEYSKDGYQLTVYDFQARPDGFEVDIDAIKIR
jgi:hypothetical protein